MGDPSSRPGRALGLDLGDVRIGVAISDDGRRLAVPFGTVRTGAPSDLRALAQIVEANAVSIVVVGHPLTLRGERGERARLAEDFASALADVLGVPMQLQDERLSTVQAERALREAGATGAERRRNVDSSSAAIILQAWLDAQRGR